MSAFLAARLFRAGRNAALVSLGAALFGLAAGAAGTILVLRKRALVSDATAPATLPGVAGAFMVAVALGGDGRALWALMVGAAVTAALGMLAVEALAVRTRLPEDAAIGAVLSVFFGAGLVGLTVVQTMSAGQQAGLEPFLLGSTAGMLLVDAVTVAVGGIVVAAAVWAFRRPMMAVAFDEGHAEASGLDVRRVDRLILLLALAVTVAGLRIVGLVLVVAMLVIPPVAARLWTDRAGGVAALSAAPPGLPTGPIVVLTAAATFALSLLLAPRGGLGARAWRRRRALAAPEDARADAQAWVALRLSDPASPLIERDDGRTPLASLLPPERMAAMRGAADGA